MLSIFGNCCTFRELFYVVILKLNFQDKNVESLVRDVRTTFGSLQEAVFQGSDLVDWLLEIGLTQSRQDGVTYGQHLIKGRIDHFYRCTLYLRSSKA